MLRKINKVTNAAKNYFSCSWQGELMAFPEFVDYVVIGAGIHGLSSAWRLAERLTEEGEDPSGRVLVLDKVGIAAGATGIACGVVRNNYFQPAMRNLMAHSVGVWESDPEAFSYHSVGYMQISCETMRDDVGQIFAEQQAIGYDSVFVEGANASISYMRGLFHDWRAQNITSVLHEKRRRSDRAEISSWPGRTVRATGRSHIEEGRL